MQLVSLKYCILSIAGSDKRTEICKADKNYQQKKLSNHILFKCLDTFCFEAFSKLFLLNYQLLNKKITSVFMNHFQKIKSGLMI